MSEEEPKKVELHLTNKEVELLMNVVGDLGEDDMDALHLQLKIANALLDSE